MQYEEMERTLGMADDDAMRLEILIDFGEKMPAVPDDAVCTEIFGCISRVEICRKGAHFYGRADSKMMRGVVAVLVAMVDGKTPDEIRKMDLRARFAALHLKVGTVSGRLTGLDSIIRFFENL